jgi:hypothetical protein
MRKSERAEWREWAVVRTKGLEVGVDIAKVSRLSRFLHALEKVKNNSTKAKR